MGSLQSRIPYYSVDLRRKIVEAVRWGMSKAEAARIFGNGLSTVKQYVSAHKSERVRELVKGRDSELLFLPSYSPGLNPIEEAFSKVKAF